MKTAVLLLLLGLAVMALLLAAQEQNDSAGPGSQQTGPTETEEREASCFRDVGAEQTSQPENGSWELP